MTKMETSFIVQLRLFIKLVPIEKVFIPEYIENTIQNNAGEKLSTQEIRVPQ